VPLILRFLQKSELYGVRDNFYGRLNLADNISKWVEVFSTLGLQFLPEFAAVIASNRLLLFLRPLKCRLDVD
jgi:hypothetical protein